MGMSNLTRRAPRREACAIHREFAKGVVEAPVTGDDWYWECREFANSLMDGREACGWWLDWLREQEQKRRRREYEKMVEAMEREDGFYR